MITKNIKKDSSTFASLQTCFGRFDTAVKLSGDGNDRNWVLMTPFNATEDELGDIVHGKFLSPVLEESEEQHLVDSKSILEKVSLVHDCDGNCVYKNGAKQVVEERETVTSEKITYEHDFTNKRNLVNRFYLGESWKYIPDSH